VAFVLIPLI